MNVTSHFRTLGKGARWVIPGAILLVLTLVAMDSAQRHSRNPSPPKASAPRLLSPGGTVTSYRTSWLGNSVGLPSGNVQHSIEALAVAGDGMIFTNSLWDESAVEAGIYKNGVRVGNAGYTHGWGCYGVQ